MFRLSRESMASVSCLRKTTVKILRFIILGFLILSARAPNPEPKIKAISGLKLWEIFKGEKYDLWH